MIHCEKAHLYLSLRLDGELDKSGSIQLNQHLSTCDTCRKKAVDFDGVHHLFRQHPIKLKEPSAKGSHTLWKRWISVPSFTRMAFWGLLVVFSILNIGSQKPVPTSTGSTTHEVINAVMESTSIMDASLYLDSAPTSMVAIESLEEDNTSQPMETFNYFFKDDLQLNPTMNTTSEEKATFETILEYTSL